MTVSAPRSSPGSGRVGCSTGMPSRSAVSFAGGAPVLAFGRSRGASGREPEGLDDTARSLRAGERVQNEAGSRSICDALLAPTPGELTFAVNRRLLAGGLVVSDAEIEEAMRLAFRHLKLVVEPGGAVALAAALAGRLDCRGRTVAVVLGGNVDPSVYARILAAA